MENPDLNPNEQAGQENTDTSAIDLKKIDWKFGILETIVTILVSIPLYVLLRSRFSFLDWWPGSRIDNIIVFVAIFLAIDYILDHYKNLVYILIAGIIGYYVVMTIRTDYSISDLFTDYKEMIYSFSNNPKPIKIKKTNTFDKKTTEKLVAACNYIDPELRNWALVNTKDYFLQYQNGKYDRTLIQSFALFKEINNKWHYVHDANDIDYFAPAKETIKTLSGDCDDHAILIATSIKAIGGRTRLVEIPGHLYPELYIGDKQKLEETVYLVGNLLFKKEAKGKNIYYHEDEDGGIWLNLDYTDHYPGAPFMGDEVIGIMEL